MKSLRLLEAKTLLKYTDVPEPSPRKGEVAVTLQAAALNRRDFWITQGLYPGVETPVTLGSDGAGTVAACGEGVDKAWLGRDVIVNPGLGWGDDEAAQSAHFHILGMPTNGTFAEHVVVPADNLHDKPEHVSWAQAAALPLAGVTAYRALVRQGGLQTGQTVLITGIGGGVATFALQFACAIGAKALVTSSSAQKLAKARDLGATAGYNYTQEGWYQKLLSEHGPADLIIDSAGGAGYESLLEIACAGGTIVNYGATTGPPEQLDLFKVFWKQLRLVGSTMGSPADFKAMLKLVAEHKIRPAVDRIVGLAQGADAVASMAQTPQFGKVVLAVS